MIRERGSEEGATLVEFAFVAPIVLLLMFTMIDLSLVIIGNTVGGNAARDGARVGIIDYLCADSWSGSPAAGHDSCATPSPQYTAISNAVLARLNNLQRNVQPVKVRCVDIDDNTYKNCSRNESNPENGVDVDRDLIEVKFTWQHIGSSPFVASASHTETARMVISGKPIITPTTIPTTTTSTTSLSTTTTSPSTTTTSSTTTTTAPVACTATVTVVPQTQAIKNSGALNSDVTITATTNNVPACTGLQVRYTPGTGAQQTKAMSGSGASWTYTIDKNAHNTWQPGDVTVEIVANSSVIGTGTFKLT